MKVYMQNSSPKNLGNPRSIYSALIIYQYNQTSSIYSALVGKKEIVGELDNYSGFNTALITGLFQHPELPHKEFHCSSQLPTSLSPSFHSISWALVYLFWRLSKAGLLLGIQYLRVTGDWFYLFCVFQLLLFLYNVVLSGVHSLIHSCMCMYIFIGHN